MAVYKEFMFNRDPQDPNPNIFREYSWPVQLFWESARITLLQMFPMRDLCILNFDHSHSFVDICYVLSGSGSICFGNGETVRMAHGSICLINSKIVHRVLPDEGSDLCLCNISLSVSSHQSSDGIPDSIVRSEASMLRAALSHPWTACHDCFECEDFLRNAIHFMYSDTPGDFVCFKNCMSNFLVRALQALTKAELPVEKHDHTADEMKSAMQVVFYIRQHFTENITLNDMAAELNYSPRQCQRLIQDYLGVGFSEFTQAHRIGLAKRMLTSTELSAAEIAGKCGFKSEKTFVQQFTSITGMSPEKWKENNTLSSAPNISFDYMQDEL